MADFSYVDKSGKPQTVSADTPEAAMKAATNIDPHSGVSAVGPTQTPTSATTSTSGVRTDATKTGADIGGADLSSFEAFKASIQPTDVKAPAAPPSTADTYEALRASQGVQHLEDQTTSLQARIDAIDNAIEGYKYDPANRAGMTEAALEGTMSEKEYTAMAEKDSLVRQQGIIQQQLTYKNSFITTMMSATQTDYSNAKAAYDDEFAKNMQLHQAFSTEKNVVTDNAKAALSTMINLIGNSGISFSEYLKSNPAVADSINSLEAQSGLPAGTMAALARSKPKANVVSTTSGYDSSGRQITTVLMQDPSTGEISKNTVYTGGSRAPKSTSTSTGVTQKQYTEMAGLGVPHDVSTTIINQLQSYSPDEVRQQLTDANLDPSYVDSVLRVIEPKSSVSSFGP